MPRDRDLQGIPAVLVLTQGISARFEERLDNGARYVTTSEYEA